MAKEKWFSDQCEFLESKYNWFNIYLYEDQRIFQQNVPPFHRKAWQHHFWIAMLIFPFMLNCMRFSVPFWILHLGLLFYVYGLGCLVYQIRDAEVVSDFIKSFFSVSILALTISNSYWFLAKRPFLIKVLKKIKDSDERCIQSGLFLEKHQRLLGVIKRIIFIFYGCNLINLTLIYYPSRINIDANEFAMTPCVGMQLTTSPNIEICKILLCVQEVTVPSVVLNYQTLMVLLVGHTAVMYQILADEIMTFNTLLEDASNYEMVVERLHLIINRHALILDITGDLQRLYSMPMGVNFGSNAVCLCLFFFLTWEEYLNFMPVAVYCFLVFFLYCFLGQRLTNAAEVYARAVYSCGWEMFKVKERKAIYIMFIQAQKPVNLRAADLISVNMETFATTSQAIYKFATVVKL